MRKSSISILLCFLLAEALSAQQYHFINYSIEHGLAQSQVEAMVQDDKGYIWFGTSLGGVSCFDGRKFTNFSSKTGLVDNQVNTIFKDSKGHIWIGTLGGLTCFDGSNFHKYPFSDTLKEYSVIAITEDKNGYFWLGTDGAGLCRFSPQDFQQQKIPFEFFTTDDGLPNNIVRSVLCRSKNNLLVGTKKGVCTYNGKSFSPVIFATEEILNVSKLLSDTKGNIWASTFGQGVYRFAISKNNDVSEVYNYKIADGLINDWIRAMLQDRDGNLWFVSKSGASKLEGSTFTSFTAKEGLISENLKCIVQDFEGSIWFGTDGKGALRFTGEAFVCFPTSDALNSDIVMSVVEDKKNNLWFSTYGNGVTCYDGQAKLGSEARFKNYTIKDGLANNTVWTSLMEKNGTLWFGTSQGVSRFDGKRFITYTAQDGFPSQEKVTAIFQDSRDNIWVGSIKGVCCLKYDRKKPEKINCSNYGEEQGFRGENVRSIFEDKKGNLWFGTSNGLICFNGTAFTHYTDKEGLTDNTVYAITEDHKENLWLGTRDGLCFYDGKKISAVKLGKEYSDNFINFLLVDQSKNLWAGTNNGIYELNTSAFYTDNKIQTTHYTAWEGIKSLESNLNASYLDSKGNLWFGTSEGLMKYDPSKQNAISDQVEPRVSITKTSLFLEDTDWLTANAIDPADGLPSSLKLQYDQNHLTFTYSGISFANPQQVNYRFMLDGFDEDWAPVTDAGFATYSNLPPGSYTFKVLAVNKQGIWTKEPAILAFQIAPPFWTTWWFYTLCVLAVLLVAYLIYHWRTIVIKHKMYLQQLIYKSRMLVLEQHTLNASMNRHFIFNALNSIQYYINKEDKHSANSYLTNFSRLIRKNLDDAENNLVSLSQELERLELYLSLENMRFSEKFSYQIHLDPSVNAEEVQIPSMLLQPFVENSIWHGLLPKQQDGTIKLDIRKKNSEYLVLTIDDNGIGVETSKKNKLHHIQDHISRGMGIVKERMNLLKKMTNMDILLEGPFETKDENGITTGTRVEIVLPINCN